MNKLFFFILFVGVTLPLMGCYTDKEQDPAKWRQPFPDAEIVYQTGNFEQSKIGFVNADGSNQVILNVGDLLIKPTWSYDGSLIYGMVESIHMVSAGYPAYWEKNGLFHICRDRGGTWFGIEQIEWAGMDNNPKVVFMNKGNAILLVDLEKCKEIKTIVDISDQGGHGIEGISYYPSSQEMLYSLVWQTTDLKMNSHLIKKDLKNNQEHILVSDGFSPSWSPDGSLIAYIKADGIYLMKADGTRQRRLSQYSFVNQVGFGSNDPILRWSPDGQWIIYDRCDQRLCLIGEADDIIYKIDINHGQEQKIIEGGAFPSWRP